MSLYPLLGTLVAALLIGACGRTAPAPAAQATPAPTPNIEATVVAEVQARLRSATALTPTPVALPSAAREDVMAFATSRGQLVHDWDQLHVGFDTWRDGLIDCDVRSVEATLREFASTIGGLALQAGALPRSASVRELADKLVAGTEGEAEAVRQLRDGWQPEDPTTFENVERARSTALALQREMQDSLSDLQERTSPSSRAHVQTYSVSFAVLSGQWDEFRSNYDSFRTREPSLSSFEVVANLGQLVDEFRSIVVAVRDLPTDDVTRDVSTFLAQAAEAEDLALRKLRGSFQLTEGVSGGEAQAPPPDGEPGTPDPDGTSGASSGPVFTPSDPGLFDAFDAHLAESNALQRRAAQELADIVEETTSEAKAAVDEFARQYGLLLARWDRFHGDYDEWRRTEGGCDRKMTAETLVQFTSDFAALTRRARDFPGGTLLGPLRELLVESAELEGEGLRELRDTWRPYDAQVYKAFESRRNTAARLLRQVAVGLDDLLTEYDIVLPQP